MRDEQNRLLKINIIINIICAHPLEINKNSYYGEYIIKVLDEAVINVDTSVLLNYSTDGVICDFKWNQHQMN